MHRIPRVLAVLIATLGLALLCAADRRVAVPMYGTVSRVYEQAYRERRFLYLEQLCEYNRTRGALVDCDHVLPGQHVYVPPLPVLMGMKEGKPELAWSNVELPGGYQDAVVALALRWKDVYGTPPDDREYRWALIITRHLSAYLTPEEARRFLGTADAADFDRLFGIFQPLPVDYAVEIDGELVFTTTPR